VKEQSKLLALLDSPNVLFSDKIKKINQNDWTQDRLLIITEGKIFNVHKGKVKREISIDKLGGISRNSQGKKPEFTLHVPSEYDYRFWHD
jgi:hypothetical protein